MKPYNEETGTKKEQMRDMFDGIAPAYDLLNHLMSFGIDRRWRRKVVRMAARNRPADILDLACGTGDMTFALAAAMPQATVTGADLSEKMLVRAREKAAARKNGTDISFIQCEAEKLPFGDVSFDAVTVAFGVRNFEDIPQGLSEMARVLKPGGTLYVLELSTPRNKIFGFFFRFYFHRILPLLGGLISRDRKAYQYLPASVDEFPQPERFTGMMDRCGLESRTAVTFLSGVARIYTGKKI